MTLGKYYYTKDFGNKVVHFRGKRGRIYQDHMLEAFVAYKDEEVNEELTFENDTDIYIELVPRTGRRRSG